MALGDDALGGESARKITGVGTNLDWDAETEEVEGREEIEETVEEEEEEGGGTEDFTETEEDGRVGATVFCVVALLLFALVVLSFCRSAKDFTPKSTASIFSFMTPVFRPAGVRSTVLVTGFSVERAEREVGGLSRDRCP